ncbi:MAG: S24 family peptidase [Akkermansiaceae bacterium]
MTKETLIKWMSENDHTNEWLADKLGVKLPTISSWRSNRPIPSKAIYIIKDLMDKDKDKEIEELRNNLILRPNYDQFKRWNEKALSEGKIIEDWAFDGLEAMADEYFSPISLLAEEEASYGNEYPFYGCMAAGQPVESQLSGETLVALSTLDPATHAIFEVNGQSAEPQFMDGDRWLVELKQETNTARKGKPAVFSDENGCYLKIYNGGKAPFSSVNPDFPDVHPGESLSLLGYPIERVKS